MVIGMEMTRMETYRDGRRYDLQITVDNNRNGEVKRQILMHYQVRTTGKRNERKTYCFDDIPDVRMNMDF
jgi:hypothetical protein